MSNEVLEKFANRLKQIREERGLSQEALALICGINRTYIGRIENLQRNPSLIIISKIANGVNMSLSEFFNY